MQRLDTYEEDTLKRAGLVAFWPLDDVQGTRARDLRNAYPGVYQAAPSLAQAGPSPVARSARFVTASSQWISVASLGAPLNPTLEIWYATSVVGGDNGLIGDLNSGVNTGAMIRFSFPRTLTFHIQATSITNAPANADDGLWHYVAATFDGTNGCIYFDGALVAGPSALTGPVVAANVFQITQYGFQSAGYFTGSVARGALWNRALSSGEIRERHQIGRVN